jgi:hypothetical protein
MSVELEPVQSSLISHRGFDADKHVLHIRFKHKTMPYGSLYEYGNVSPELYAEGCAHISSTTGELSFGQWFQLVVKKDDKKYPFRKLEDPHTGDGFVGTTLDFESGTPVPATTPKADEPLIQDTPRIIEARKELENWLKAPQTDPANRRIVEDAQAELRAAQEEALQAKYDALKAEVAKVGTLSGAAIVIKTPEAAKLALITGNAIARMRDALERELRPEIERHRAPYIALLAVLNKYDKPLESDQKRLRDGIAAFNRNQRLIEEQENARLRRQQEAEAEARAAKEAEELHLHDAITAEAQGDIPLMETIMASAPLPVAPRMPAPARVASAIPDEVAKAGKKKYKWEVKNQALIPDEYFILDTKAIDKVVDAMGDKANTLIPGIWAYDAGTVAFSKK